MRKKSYFRARWCLYILLLYQAYTISTVTTLRMQPARMNDVMSHYGRVIILNQSDSFILLNPSVRVPYEKVQLLHNITIHIMVNGDVLKIALFLR